MYASDLLSPGGVFGNGDRLMSISSCIAFLKKNRATVVLLLGILVLAAFVRLYHLDSIPNGLNQDEAVNGYDAYSLAYTLRDHHGAFLPILLQSFGDWVSPTLTYLTVPFVRIFGLSLFVIRLPVAISGIITVFLAYIFLFQLTRRKDLSLISALLLALIPWNITLTRWAIPPSIVPFLLLLSVVSFYWAKADASKHAYYKYFLFIISATLLTYAYPTEKFFAPILVFGLCAIFLYKDIKKALLVFLSYLLLISPQYLLSYINPTKYNARLNDVSLFKTYHSYGELIHQLLSRYKNYILPDFNFGVGDLDTMHHVPGFPSSYVFLAPLFYVGIAFSCFVVLKFFIQRKETKFSLFSWQDHLFLLLWFFVSPVAASLTLSNDHLLRVVHYLPLTVVYFVIGLSLLITLMSKFALRWLNGILYATYIAIALSTLLSFWIFAGIYYDSYFHSSKRSFQYGIASAMDYALAHQDQYNHIYVDDRINEPYIYYLFYSAYNPAQIDYQKLNEDYVPGAHFSARQIDKYSFVLVTIPADSPLVDKVADQDGVWYMLYVHGKDLYIEKTA